MVTIAQIEIVQCVRLRPLLIAAFVTVCIAALVSCKSDSKKAPVTGKSTPATTATQTTTASAEQVDAGQLDFFTERYLPADERLKRRQDRLKATLTAPPASPAASAP